jgi:hypothetical protein
MPRMGVGELQESRFATVDLGSTHTGVTDHRFRAGARQAFGHRHHHEGRVRTGSRFSPSARITRATASCSRVVDRLAAVYDRSR